MPKQSAPLGWAEEQARKISQELGYTLIDVELVKESTGQFLRFYINTEAGVSLSDCEAFHRKIQPLMEKVDYDYMEVSSPGADRPLKSPADFACAQGKIVEVRLYKPLNGAKIYSGELIGLIDGQVAILDALGTEQKFDQKQVALVKPVIDFDEEDLQDEIELSPDQDDELFMMDADADEGDGEHEWED